MMLPRALVLCALLGTSSAFMPAAITRSGSALQATKAGKSSEKPLTWQEALEQLLVPTTPLAQRQVLLQNVLSRTSEIRRDVEEALKQGDVDPLLTPGLQAVRRQLSEDIIPQLASEPEQAARAILDELPKLAQRSISSLPRSPKDFADAVREMSTTLPSEARNMFLRTPEGLETPSFTILAEIEDYQIREYAPYAVAYTEMGGEGAGPVLGSPTVTGTAFNTLASYLFGDNSGREAMAMTTPVEIRKDACATYSMRFVLPSKYTTETAPRPGSARVRLTTTPARTLAVVEFPGFATDGEVRRQLVSLLSALERDGIEIVDPSSYLLFQYNPPQTLPWLRRNEVLVEVSGGWDGADAREEEVEVVVKPEVIEGTEDWETRGRRDDGYVTPDEPAVGDDL